MGVRRRRRGWGVVEVGGGVGEGGASRVRAWGAEMGLAGRVVSLGLVDGAFPFLYADRARSSVWISGRYGGSGVGNV